MVTFIDNARKVHGDKYDYTKSEYVNKGTKVSIICPTHGEFRQTPNNHVNHKMGCPGCSTSGFDPNKPAILYYLSVDCGTAYKIGITNKTVQDRFSAEELSRIKVLTTTEYAYGRCARAEEQRIMKEYRDSVYKGPSLLTSGNTELFSYDVLGKDMYEY
jgi:hypothetical protein